LPFWWIVGYREEADGSVSGPHRIRSCTSLDEGRSVCLACLWFERERWCAVGICRADWSEIVRYRRFPPGRKRPEEEGIDFVWGQQVRHKRTKGARLALADGGRRRKSFGGNANERSGFEGI